MFSLWKLHVCRLAPSPTVYHFTEWATPASPPAGRRDDDRVSGSHPVRICEVGYAAGPAKLWDLSSLFYAGARGHKSIGKRVDTRMSIGDRDNSNPRG
jgi:hypothetical protein